MGVRGLESFIEREPFGYKIFSIADTAKLHKKVTGAPAVVVVNGCSCTRTLYRPLLRIPGGQLKEFQATMEIIIKRFRSMDVEPVFFFEGPLPEQKIPTWIKRKTDKILKVQDIFQKIRSGLSIGSIEYDMGDSMCLVCNLDIFLIDVLKNNGCKVFTSIQECDKEIVKYAMANNCLAILAQNSDYLIYPGDWKYWSMKHFDLREMKTVEYNRKRIEKCLSLPRNRLPLWASLMGNDFLHFDDIRVFHAYLSRKGQREHRAIQIANYVRDRSEQQIKDILHNLGGASKNLPALLVESISSYDIDLTLDPADSIVKCSEGENWGKILRVAHEKHRKCVFPNFVYGVLVSQNYRCGESTEDDTITDLPLNQKLLKKLRQKSYGILFHEKPQPKNGINQVKELIVNGREFGSYDFVDPLPPQGVLRFSLDVHHPGLLTLWNDNKGPEDFRWNLLCSSIGVDTDKVRRIPLMYVIPALSLFYILDQKVEIEGWEARAIIASVVTLSLYTAERLAQLDVLTVDPRALHLYTLVTQSFHTVYNLNAVCGHPVPSKETIMSSYQDGKLFHVKYSAAKKGEKAENLCENNVTAIDNFRSIIDLLPTRESLV